MTTLEQARAFIAALEQHRQDAIAPLLDLHFVRAIAAPVLASVTQKGKEHDDSNE